MQAQGLLKGGSEGCSIVAYGDRWYDTEALRFFDDEPVRHKLLDLMVSFFQCHLTLIEPKSGAMLKEWFVLAFFLHGIEWVSLQLVSFAG